MPNLLFESAGVSVTGGAEPGGLLEIADRWSEGAIVLEFPVLAARVDLAGEGSGVADPTVARVHDTRAGGGSPRILPGSDLLALSVDALSRAIGTAGEGALRRNRLVPVAAGAYLEHLRLLDDLRRRGTGDPHAAEQSALAIAARVLGSAASDVPAKAVSPRQRDLAASVKLLAAATRGERLRIAPLAARLGCSVFHLCHTFRDVEGTTIGAYQQQLRLRGAARRLLEAPGAPLSDLALEFGFSSHSHFTAAFRKAFGTTPSALAASQRIAC